MNEALWLYAFTRLDAINTLFSILSCVFAVASIYAGLMGNEDQWRSEIYKASARRMSKLFPKTAIASAIFAVLVVLTPSKNDAIFIVAGTGVIEAAKSEHVQRVAGKAAAVVEKALDDYLDKKK